jgi:maleate cis-trans isomerase
LAGDLVAEGADLIHLEGTPPFLIVGYSQEQKIVRQWESELGRPVFTSAMSQVSALRALGVRRLVDAGYDPTTGPHAEEYFSEAGFDVLCVEKVAVDWGGAGDVADEVAFEMLRRLVGRHPRADGLCLQGSSKWRLSSVIPRLESELGIPIVHPVAARYWELMTRLDRREPRSGLGRLLSEMPPHPCASDPREERE